MVLALSSLGGNYKLCFSNSPPPMMKLFGKNWGILGPSLCTIVPLCAYLAVGKSLKALTNLH